MNLLGYETMNLVGLLRSAVLAISGSDSTMSSITNLIDM